VGGERGELEEGAGGVDEPVDALAGKELAALDVPGARALRAARAAVASCSRRSATRARWTSAPVAGGAAVAMVRC
jgi:hypothetical protein